MGANKAIPAEPASPQPARTHIFGKIRSLLAQLKALSRKILEAFVTTPYRYESAHKVFGFPLLAIDVGFADPDRSMRHAVGVIAIGTKATGVFAIGLLVARGIFVLAPLAVGVGVVSIASLGVVTISVFGAGLVSVSAFAIGYLAVGVVAIGYKSLGIVAFGREVVGIVGAGKHLNVLFHLFGK